MCRQSMPRCDTSLLARHGHSANACAQLFSYAKLVNGNEVVVYPFVYHALLEILILSLVRLVFSLIEQIIDRLAGVIIYKLKLWFRFSHNICYLM